MAKDVAKRYSTTASLEITMYIRSDSYLSGAPRHTKMIQDPRSFPGAAKYRDWIRQMHNLPNMAAPDFL